MSDEPKLPTVRALPDWVIGGAVAIKMQQVTGVSLLTGLPVVIIGPVFVDPKPPKKRRKP